jgi:hypothetical protein
MIQPPHKKSVSIPGCKATKYEKCQGVNTFASYCISALQDQDWEALV